MLIDGNYRQFELENGLVVVLKKTNSGRIASELSIKFGTLHEEEEQRGIAHLSEHSLLLGGTDDYSIEASEEKIDRFGFMNAITKHDETTITGGLLSEDIEEYLDFLSSIVFNPTFAPEIVEQEKGAILREISDRRSNPHYKDCRILLDAVYPDDHPFRIETIGDPSAILSLTPNDLRRFHKMGFGTRNMELILVGGLPSETKQLVRKYFNDRPEGEDRRVKIPSLSPLEKRVIIHTFAPELCNTKNKNESNSFLNIELIVPVDFDKDGPVISLLSSILGERKSSRLFKRVRKRERLAYSISSEYNSSLNTGNLDVIGSIHSINQEQAIEIIFEEFRKLQDNPVSYEELQRHKKAERYRLLRSSESIRRIAYDIKDYLKTGITVDEMYRRICEVTPKDIQRAAREYLPRNRDGNYAMLLRDPLKS